MERCIKTLKQIIRDLDKEKSASLQRIKLYKLELQFVFNIDFEKEEEYWLYLILLQKLQSILTIITIFDYLVVFCVIHPKNWEITEE